MQVARGPGPVSLTFDGGDALEITTHVRVGATPTVTTRRVRARVVPGIPLVHGVGKLAPPNTIELLDSHGAVLFRRAFAPPGFVEIPGRIPRWVRLPFGYTQVRVTLVPFLPTATTLTARTGGGDWLRHALPGGV